MKKIKMIRKSNKKIMSMTDNEFSNYLEQSDNFTKACNSNCYEIKSSLNNAIELLKNAECIFDNDYIEIQKLIAALNNKYINIIKRIK